MGILKQEKTGRLNVLAASCFVLLFFLVTGCAGRHPETFSEPPAEYSPVLPKLGFTIQVGAFERIENALRLTEKLQGVGIEAYHFVHPAGLYKVRFGNYSSFAQAKKTAARLLNDNLIQEYYIVKPGDYGVAGDLADAEGLLRQNIVRTATRFIGVPYKWGGRSREEGFDCSGLTMVAYQLNGLELPRNSRAQFRAGRSISRDMLQPGDLVFFRTGSSKRVSHVGIYAGNNTFIHAPRQGQVITTTSLTSYYFRKRYVGARAYF